ncbi:hypothetical protein ACH5RR_032193 [Cinchona calisaya]|uniref:Uncharacterized protein n=1 Tax=Cinchona calisaya TaxID=153742 RepID=A0ABD2YHE9_9GENT
MVDIACKFDVFIELLKNKKGLVLDDCSLFDKSPLFHATTGIKEEMEQSMIHKEVNFKNHVIDSVEVNVENSCIREGQVGAKKTSFYDTPTNTCNEHDFGKFLKEKWGFLDETIDDELYFQDGIFKCPVKSFTRKDCDDTKKPPKSKMDWQNYNSLMFKRLGALKD